MIYPGKRLGDLLGKLVDLDLTLEQLVLLDADVLLALDLTFHVASNRSGGAVIGIRVKLLLQRLDLGDDTLFFGLELGDLILDLVEKLHDLILLALDLLALRATLHDRLELRQIIELALGTHNLRIAVLQVEKHLAIRHGHAPSQAVHQLQCESRRSTISPPVTPHVSSASMSTSTIGSSERSCPSSMIDRYGCASTHI